MKPQDFIDAVNELNEEIPEEVYAEAIYYDYITDGFTNMVEFAHFNIFHSDFDTDERVKDVGTLKEYLIMKRNEYIDMLIKVKS
jgi:hypothetical protein